MLTLTGDSAVMYAVALDRHPATGELINLAFTSNEAEAKEHYDNHDAVALVRVTLDVVSSVDLVINHRKDD